MLSTNINFVKQAFYTQGVVISSENCSTKIPVLTKAIQEQNEAIQKQNKMIATLQKEVEMLKKKNS